MKTVFVLGGYEPLGQAITKELIKAGVPVIVAGPNRDAAMQFTHSLQSRFPHAIVGYRSVQAGPAALEQTLGWLKPGVLIDAAHYPGIPIQAVVLMCLRYGTDFIDTSEDLHRVASIKSFHDAASQAGVHLLWGSVAHAALSAALLQELKVKPKSHEPAAADAVEYVRFYASLDFSTWVSFPHKSAFLQSLGERVASSISQKRNDKIHSSSLGPRPVTSWKTATAVLLQDNWAIQNVDFKLGVSDSMAQSALGVVARLKRLGFVARPLRLARWVLRRLFKPSAPRGCCMMIEVATAQRRVTYFLNKTTHDSNDSIHTLPTVTLATQLASRLGPPPGAYAAWQYCTWESCEAVLIQAGWQIQTR